jgi:hypothetical protein
MIVPNQGLYSANNLLSVSATTTYTYGDSHLGDVTQTTDPAGHVSYNQNLWMHHLNGDAAYLPV